MKYTTRIAPSPTGPMHLGTARTAYFNWLAARASGGKFILRIDDTDVLRSEPKWVDQILKALDWLGLDYDQIVYQSQQLKDGIYSDYANLLMSSGDAQLNKDDSISLCLPEMPDLGVWNDNIGGVQKIKIDNVRGFNSMTLMKSDGTATYHYASVVDDISLKVNHVIRGVDHLLNTAKHVLLYRLLGTSQLPKFSHVGLLHQNKKKLSKRDGAFSVLQYKDNGVCPEAVLNLLGRCGWGPTIDDKSTSLLPSERMLDLFLDGGKMRAAPSNVDLVKLDSYDRKYKARNRS